MIKNKDEAVLLSIGLMSGTSMDGIDAALIQTDGDHHIIEMAHISEPYQLNFILLLKSLEYTIRQALGDINKASEQYPQIGVFDYLTQELQMTEQAADEKIIELIHYLGEPLSVSAVITLSTKLHARAVENLLKHANVLAEQVDVIGYHGQTLYHQPDKKISIIIGNGQMLADETGIAVVNDFRTQDIINGGQGAPFAPLYHQALAIRDKRLPLAVVNCGGIANITLISNEDPLQLVGYDTGPGNGLIDRLIKQRTHGKESMDRDGQYGCQGKVNEVVLMALYEKSIIKNHQNYFKLKPPKALDIGDLELIAELDQLNLPDACATLEAFTADTIINSIELLGESISVPHYWVLAGGGWNNPVILNELRQRLRIKFGNDIKVLKADEAGWNSQALEAQIFAYFAVRSLQGKYLSVPGTTRVKSPTTGGRAYRPKVGCSAKVDKLLADNPMALICHQPS